MNGQVSWWVELAVEPGRIDEFRELTREMVEFARGETGVLDYRRFVSADGTSVHVYERYADSAAALAHLRHFAARFGARYSRLVERRRFTVDGDPGAALMQELDGYGAVYYSALVQ